MIIFETGNLSALEKYKPDGPKTAEEISNTPQVKVGKPIPDMKLTDLEGKTVSLSDCRGTIVVLEFWATWCPDCREVLPHLQTLSDTSGDAGFSVVTVSVDTRPETVRTFMKENGYSFTVLHGGINVREMFAVKAIPTLYLIDRKGVLRSTLVEYGSRGTEEVDRKIRQLIDEN
ncbi:MAG: TlpA family protein disulfide reductase [Candidatus Latescibacteria bacterium]|nr:TlpA family protein disulfide reductase [Candidatus Latescibacterota bacterium]